MTHSSVGVGGPRVDHAEDVLTEEALQFVAGLHRSFNPRRLELLAARAERQRRFDAGELPDFAAETARIRDDPGWRVAPAPADLDDRRVEIRIEDSGPGIPESELPRLFTPFHTTKANGTGLGLAYSKKTIEGMNGEINLANRQEAAGAVLTILLPNAR